MLSAPRHVSLREEKGQEKGQTGDVMVVGFVGASFARFIEWFIQHS